MKIPFNSIESWKKSAVRESLDFLKNKADLSKRDEEAYHSGFLQGWKELEKTLKLHGFISIDMMK